MLKSRSDPSLVALSSEVYRTLLALYPPRFKQDYGPHMAQVFRDCCRRAYRDGGALALLALWARTVLDYLKTVIEEYARGGTYMTREKFIKLSGWALLVGSVAVFIGWLAESRPEYDRFNAASLPIDRYANQAAMPILAMGILLISLGMLGMRVRYGGLAGRFGRFTLAFGVLSGLVSAIGMIGLAIYDSDPWWSMFFLGWSVQYLMLALFGVACLRRHVLPRWNSLPLLAGVWLPGYILISGIYESITGDWLELSNFVFPMLFLLGAAGFAGLGYLLQSDAQPAGPMEA